MTELHIDLETYSATDLVKCGAHRYVDDPSFEIMLFGYAFDDEPITVIDRLDFESIPQRVLDALRDPAIKKWAHNAAFERLCIQRGLGIPCPAEQWRCTSVLALSLGLPGRLGDLGPALGLGRDFSKMAIGKALIRYFCIPCKPTKKNGFRTRNLPEHAPDRWRLFKDYCAQDIVTERDGVHKRLIKYDMLPIEWKAWELDQRINDYGVKVDMGLVNNAIAADEQRQSALLEQAIEITGLKNPKSRAQLLKWLQEEDDGLELEDLQKKTVAKILKSDETSDTVRKVLLLRQELSKSSTAKYKAIRRSVCSDGRVHGMFQFNGANRTHRWAGRLVQLQNLPQNKLEDIDLARNLVKAGEFALLERLFGNVPQTLSELIRTAFVAPDGKKLAPVDFSAVEARGLAYLAGEEWRLDVFRSHGKIYEASASKMFNIPIETIGKGPVRQKGKIAELALGYGGGEGALLTMGAIEMGLKTEELQPLVEAWRLANTKVVAFWWAVGNAAIRAVKEQITVKMGLPYGGQLLFIGGNGMLFIELPSGRRLSYVQPKMIPSSKFPDRKSLSYMGNNQKTKRWERIETYGPKLCLAKGTQVLTAAGWLAIEEVRAGAWVWDGDAWVVTAGAVCNGRREAIEAYGAFMTPDHEVLTTGGWKSASQSERYNRAPCRLPDGYSVPRERRKEVALGNAVRLRSREVDNRSLAYRAAEAGHCGILWVQEEAEHRSEADSPRHEQAPGLRGVAQYARSLPLAVTSSLEKLRWSGHYGLLALARGVREFLGGHGADVFDRANTGTTRQQFWLLAEQLPMGFVYRSSAQPSREPIGRRENGSADLRGNRDRLQHGRVSNSSRGTESQIGRDAGRITEVFDLINCGPRNRFVIAAGGAPLIVHNCENIVQAFCRDLLRDAMLAIDAELALPIPMHIHDEAVPEVERDESLADLEEIMGRESPWAPGLPLRGDGFLTSYYRKEQ